MLAAVAAMRWYQAATEKTQKDFLGLVEIREPESGDVVTCIIIRCRQKLTARGKSK
jgi:hypothetical protein